MMADNGKRLKTEEVVTDDEQKIADAIKELEGFHESEIKEQVDAEYIVMKQNYKESRKRIFVERNKIIESLPCFWMSAILGHRRVRRHMREVDFKILKHLTSLEVVDNKKTELIISFRFSPNCYFEGTEHTKTFEYSSKSETIETIPTVKKNAGITWKVGKEISDNEKKGNKSPTEESFFFKWFNETPDVDPSMHTVPYHILRVWNNPLRFIEKRTITRYYDGHDGFGEVADAMKVMRKRNSRI